MDLLGGYGDSGDEGSDQEQAEQAATLRPRLPAVTAAPDAAPQLPRVHAQQQQQPYAGGRMTGLQDGVVGPSRAHAPPAFPEAEVPAPQKQDLWASLPKPKAKRVVQLSLPINKAMLAATKKQDDEDDARAARKRRKANPGRSSLLDLLPAPQNSHAPTGTRLALGAGDGAAIDLTTAAPKPQGASRAQDSDEDDPMARLGPMPEAGAFYVGGPADDEGEDPTDAPLAGPSAAPEPHARPRHHQQQGQGSVEGHSTSGYAAHEYGAGAYYVGGGGDYAVQQQHPGYQWQQQQQQQPYGGGCPLPPQLMPQGDDPGQMLMAQALMAEQERAARKGQAMDFSGMTFKEVRQADLTYVPPAQREAATSVRGALGSEYAATLRAEAKGHEGTGLAKRKHQIGTLFHNAKMKELEILEGKASQMASKRETQAKYGW